MPTVRSIQRRYFAALLALPLFVAACSSSEPRGDSEPKVRVTSEERESSVAGIITTRSRKTTVEPISPDEPIDSPPQRSARAGLLTAADHDDLLNSDLYAKYAGRFLQGHGGDLPFVDTRTRVAVKVVDSGGRPVPFAKVDVERPGSPLHLVAAADGTASLYPKLDKIPERTTLKVASAAATVTRGLDLASGRTHSIVIALPGAARTVSAMDVALVVDTTGSMGDEMEYLQAELDSIVARLKRESGNLDLRIGVIVYRDEGDDYVVRSAPLSSDIGAIRSMLSDQVADGGGDMPEAVDQAIAAAERLQWRPDAAKAMLLVADAPPHEGGIASTLASAQRLRSRGVQIVPVAASGVEDSAQFLMRTMAALTQGRYIFLTDDSGVGNAHAEPDISCYVVTHLDQLIGRVLAGIAEGRRIEASQGEVMRVVGNYDRGRCLASGQANQS